MKDCTKLVGLDVHKSTIAVAIAEGGRMPPLSYGLIEKTPEAIARPEKRLSKGKSVRSCYEAGPCGYEVHRQITELGLKCDVVAPSLIPRKAGERIKTDRRDAMSLARLYRAGELTAVWVPDPEHEAMRDLVRAREDLKGTEPRQLMAYLGLVPREHSSGASQWRGGVTKTGNGHARRGRGEAAWTYRLPARKSARLQRKAERTSELVQACTAIAPNCPVSSGLSCAKSSANTVSDARKQRSENRTP